MDEKIETKESAVSPKFTLGGTFKPFPCHAKCFTVYCPHKSVDSWHIFKEKKNELHFRKVNMVAINKILFLDKWLR